MKRSVFGVAALVGWLLFVASPNAGAHSQGDAVRVLISNALKTSLEALRPDAERAVGRPLAMEFSSTAALKMRIQSGERFDATLITLEAIRDLIKEGKLAATPPADLGFSPLVVGIRAGAPKPDLATIDGLKRTLLSAKSITYPRDGATRGYLEPRLEVAGPLPGDLRHQVSFAGAASATAANAAAVKGLLEFLSGPRAAAMFKAKGVSR